MSPEASRPVVFGEVLFDRFPDGQELLGGAPFNVAWHLRGFGLDPLFVSRVGDDERGDRIREAMAGWGLDLTGLQVDGEHATGTVEVRPRGEDVSYDIVAERAYDFVQWPAELADTKPKLLYHGTLALRHETSRRTLERLLQAWPVPIFVDVNLRAPWWTAASVRRRLQDADTVKLNEEELDALIPGPEDSSLRAQKAVADFGWRRLCVTRGRRGATMFRPNRPPLSVEPDRDLLVVDPVGAGDAFSAVLLLGAMLDWDPRTCLTRAQEFAGAVVGVRGALPHDRHFYEPLCSAWSLP